MLKERKIAGAGSDVFEVEPATENHPLFQLENIIEMPYMVVYADEALRKMGGVAVDITRAL